MIVWKLLCLFSLVTIFYSYLGYGIVLYLVLRVKRLFWRATPPPVGDYTPTVTFLVAAYNESAFIHLKIANTLELEYPKDKFRILFVTDGSTDSTNNIISRYEGVELMYEPQRNGKTAAVNRAMKLVDSEIVIFSDANTLLNPEAVRELVKHFRNEKTGAVAGEKKVIPRADSGTEGAGEGAYWKYESLLKRWDAELYSVMGAAGELLAVRTKLYQPVSEDTILDDFMISFNINRMGYTVQYESRAYAMESPSASLTEEFKRKVRIAAGGFQAMGRLLELLNIFRYPAITWQYVSHRVLRWTLAPLCLALLLISNLMVIFNGADYTFIILFVLQMLFYGAAYTGFLMAQHDMKIKYFYIPFYFVFMNIAVYKGFIRFMRGRQSAIWERSERAIEG
ncbi:cellulose synthase/poly-beta-1,6-N-acetylglucosamine synthase-like glycosyltransferase [Chitinophaga dinghuensis]|uniref:Cellulose synthase/poly-beta-1,6-N-acetylglucosamine synthase-like glycosyltransferase n=1 Tax=Chitinophaga dinghuensis TaxID=1539050 RepID=A0A327VYR9_9BACT|nr:glycosyltransferase family 2 protein [Chitinophaga dinghuensis]RAJ79944.1 cellulose synthase/poly-beta-1,6-N-acetylglucosamine synthase-like glycosyltransferase [Chitinophaga dinghuensis]